MKFVESAEFESISSYLCFETPDCSVAGNLDLFTTKPATSDRKLIRELDRQLELKAGDFDEVLAEEDYDVVEFVDTKLDEMKLGSLKNSHSFSSHRSSRESISKDRKKSHSHSRPALPQAELQTQTQPQTQTQTGSQIQPGSQPQTQESTDTSPNLQATSPASVSSAIGLPINGLEPLGNGSAAHTDKYVSFAAGSIGSIGSIGSDTGAGDQSQLLSPPASYGKRRALSSSMQHSPFGPLDQGQSRKQYAYLIAVLNASDPDRDYSTLQPEQFTRETNYSKVINGFNTMVLGLGSPPPPGMWDTVDRHIDLKECRIYSLVLPQNFMQDEPGVVWWKMWFFFNKRRKRVIFLQLRTSRDEKPDGDAVLGELE